MAGVSTVTARMLSSPSDAPFVSQSVSDEPAEQRLARQLRVEGALVEATHRLVSPERVDVADVLGIVADAADALCAYLVTIPDDDALQVDGDLYAESTADTQLSLETALAASSGRLVLWHRDGPSGRQRWLDAARQNDAPARRDEAHVAVVPILSRSGRLFGYLGFEYGRSGSDAELRVLNVLGDVLSAYVERVRAEEALRQSEERWRRLVEFHPEPILISMDGTIVYVNASGVSLLGGTAADDIVGRRTMDFVSAEVFGEIEAEGARVEAGERVEALEREIIRIDGRECTVEWFAVPVKYEGRTAAQMVLRDVTQRKQAERALRASEDRYRTFVETISEGIWRVELAAPVPVDVSTETQVEAVLSEGFLAEANRSLAELLGRGDAAELVGTALSDLAPCFPRALVAEFVECGHQLGHAELAWSERSDGIRHLVLHAVGTVEAGRLIRIWGSCVDVTERVELERQIVSDLEHQQQEIGRDLHDGVGQYLTGVRMLAGNLSERFFAEGQEGHELARKVVRFAEEASACVRQIYTGLAPVQLFEDGLAAALRELAANLNDLPNITCRYVHDGADVQDPERRLHLYRIAQEATNNAMKHAKADTITITLVHEGDDLVLCVEDDGQGFDTSERTSRSLGLRSMSHRAHAADASLTLRSEPGMGTRVHCLVPRVD